MDKVDTLIYFCFQPHHDSLIMSILFHFQRKMYIGKNILLLFHYSI